MPPLDEDALGIKEKSLTALRISHRCKLCCLLPTLHYSTLCVLLCTLHIVPCNFYVYF